MSFQSDRDRLQLSEVTGKMRRLYFCALKRIRLEALFVGRHHSAKCPSSPNSAVVGHPCVARKIIVYRSFNPLLKARSCGPLEHRGSEGLSLRPHTIGTLEVDAHFNHHKRRPETARFGLHVLTRREPDQQRVIIGEPNKITRVAGIICRRTAADGNDLIIELTVTERSSQTINIHEEI